MAKPEARNETRSVFAGLLVLAVVVAGLYVTTKAQTGHFLPVPTVKMAFDDVHTLQVNDDLRVYSSRIGRVSAIEFEDDTAIVTAELISGSPTIYKDASAQVLSVSPLALKYVNLNPGTPEAGVLEPGAVIPASQNISSSDLQEVLEILDPKTRELATSTVRELGSGLGGHGRDLNDFLTNAPDLLTDLGTVSDTLASREFDLPGVLASTDRLASRLNGREEQLRALIGSAEVTLAAIGTDNGQPLAETLRTAPPALRELRPALESLEAPLADTQVTMETISPGAREFGEAVPDVRGLLREGVPVLNDVPDVADQAAPALEDLEEGFADARPVAPRASELLVNLEEPLQVLAPYAPEIGQFFVRGHSFVSEGPAPNVRYARLSAVNLSPIQATGGLFPSKFFAINEYPEPGEATGDRNDMPIPAGIVPARNAPRTGPAPESDSPGIVPRAATPEDQNNLLIPDGLMPSGGGR